MRIFGRKEPKSDMGQAMAAGLAQSELQRPQSSQDALDQALGINPYLLYSEEAIALIKALAIQPNKDGTYVVNPRYAALLIQADYTPRASFMAPIDAEIGIRRAAIMIRRIKMKMTEAEYESGGALVADSVHNTIITPNYLSGIEGKIAKLTKVSPKSMEVTYREAKKPEG